MITKDSIETAYSFLHQKQRIYVHSTLDWQKDDIELAISDYANDMSQELYDAISGAVAAGLIFSLTTNGFRRTLPRPWRYWKRCYNEYGKF